MGQHMMSEEHCRRVAVFFGPAPREGSGGGSPRLEGLPPSWVEDLPSVSPAVELHALTGPGCQSLPRSRSREVDGSPPLAMPTKRWMDRETPVN